jgi:hypothetical protein
MQKADEYQKKFYVCFVDYTNTFHCVDHDKSSGALQKSYERQLIRSS